jgi:hypothetical protein
MGTGEGELKRILKEFSENIGKRGVFSPELRRDKEKTHGNEKEKRRGSR